MSLRDRSRAAAVLTLACTALGSGSASRAFHEFTALIAPRPLLVGQAVGERRPLEEENHAAVAVYRALGTGENVRYVWYAGDHDFPPEMQREAVEWTRWWLGEGK